MTDPTRLVRDDVLVNPATGNPVHCFVHHKYAGAPCERPAALTVYGLHFCREHGNEARIGAEMEVWADAAYFFDRFRNPHTPDFNPLIEDALVSWGRAFNDGGPSDRDHADALRRAYPDAPEGVREMVRRWERDEWGDENGIPPLDQLLDSLRTLHKLLRIAHEDGEHWLVELLEEQREGQSAQAAFALEESARRREAGQRPAG